MLKTIKTFLLNYIFTQLLITLVSIPILVQWGMSISVASFIGNLLFLPFLMVFLFASSLVFMIELMGISFYPLYFFLELIVYLWRWSLSYGSLAWLVSFSALPALLMWPLPLAGLAYTMKSRAGKKHKLCIVSLLLLSECALLQATTWYSRKHYTLCPADKRILIMHHQDLGIIVKDRGLLKREEPSMNSVPFKIIPALISCFGTRTISYLILTPGPGTLMHALQLCDYAQIDTIVLSESSSDFLELSIFCEKRRIRLLSNIPDNVTLAMQQATAQKSALQKQYHESPVSRAH